MRVPKLWYLIFLCGQSVCEILKHEAAGLRMLATFDDGKKSISHAYKQLALKHHSDRETDPAKKAAADELFKQLSGAKDAVERSELLGITLQSTVEALKAALEITKPPAARGPAASSSVPKPTPGKPYAAGGADGYGRRYKTHGYTTPPSAPRPPQSAPGSTGSRGPAQRKYTQQAWGETPPAEPPHRHAKRAGQKSARRSGTQHDWPGQYPERPARAPYPKDFSREIIEVGELGQKIEHACKIAIGKYKIISKQTKTLDLRLARTHLQMTLAQQKEALEKMQEYVKGLPGYLKSCQFSLRLAGDAVVLLQRALAELEQKIYARENSLANRFKRWWSGLFGTKAKAL